jgi:taurine dioxygenase
MDLRPLSSALGAEVADVDVRDVLSEMQIGQLKSAYEKYHLLLFRNQVLDADQQEKFVSLFGPLIDDIGDGQFSGLISNMIEDHAGYGPLPFHSDYAFTAYPAQGIALYAIELPPEGTSTWFANMVGAADDLEEELRRNLAGASTTHSLGFFVTGDEGAKSRDYALPDDVPRYRHPLLRTHPRTGEQTLFITDLHVERINDLPDDESREIIDSLLTHLYSPAHVYEQRWQVGDLVIWDNEALQHSRADISRAKPRTFRRNSLNTARWSDMVGTSP